ncbi:hypothetical protein O181_014889 [Austropuccinia psidii MF-1]|uniref:Uncharacterized protein n=1 Tax=Austropuccinia psidii MF-1 TaxID=1389203 RepID=A0A9Q3C0Z0_9BASI|nr:hypothetical protein [Austropuccinia psidii MF-1]
MAFGPYSLSLATHGPKHHLWPQAISYNHWPFWLILHLTINQANTFVLGLGGPSGLSRASVPSSHHQGLWLNPVDYGVYGLNGLFGPFRPLMISMAHGLWDPQVPFGLNPMGKSISPQGQVGPPEPNFSPNVINPKMAKEDPRTQIGHFQPMASGTHQRPPAQVKQGFPSIQGKTSPSSMYTVPKDPGVVNIWYNIPLCTTFAQQSNDYAFKTQLCLSN